MKKLRKLIDIQIDDVTALQILAARRRQSLKTVIESFLHQLAEETIRMELENRVEKMKNEIQKS
ncbi:MAG: hypothetical protein LBJ72_09485 [Dysgonamonadaceae bacterium]|jgi:hypothetical protein|nr:hypothetical protein [Dysgonamonadaceae bacterium]